MKQAMATPGDPLAAGGAHRGESAQRVAIPFRSRCARGGVVATLVGRVGTTPENKRTAFGPTHGWFLPPFHPLSVS